MNRAVLCVVELDNYPEEVVARAGWLAKLHDCDLELILSDPTINLPGESFVSFPEAQLLADAIKNEQDTMLQQLAATAGELGVSVRTSISHERPEADMIVSKAEEFKARLVVKGTHWHSPSERASLAYTDWRLMRRLEAPLWFVKPAKWKESPVIVVAVDPTHSKDEAHKLDQKIVNAAQDIAGRCHGSVVLIHIYQRLEEIGSRATWNFNPVKLPIEKLDKQIRDEHRKALDELAKECGVADDAAHLLPGRTHELLPAFARTHGASLVVMGALARSGLKKRAVGSTTARVLDHLPCDVLIVHA